MIAVIKLNRKTVAILSTVRITGKTGKTLSVAHTIQEKTIIQNPNNRFVQPIKFKANCKRSMNSCCTRK
jgi:hypothetical protein